MLNHKKLQVLRAAVLVAALIPLASCTNDDTPAEPAAQNPDDTYTLTVMVPAEAMQTRATVDATDAEAAVDELWFCAFPQGGKGAKLVTNLLPSGGTPNHKAEDNPKYSSYDVNLEKGEYKIYVVANVKDYGVTINGNTEESVLENLKLDFSQNGRLNTNGLSGKIPMGCLPKEIKDSDGGTSPGKINGTTGVYTLDATGQSIYADLTMLCAKVRYTILFDFETKSGDYANEFYDYKAVDYDGAAAKNVRKETYWDLTKDNATDPLESLSINLKKVKMDDANTTTLWNSYWNMTASSNYPNDFATQDVEGSWTDANQKRAWQGIVYLPENKNTTKTTITLTPANNSNITQDAGKNTFNLNAANGGDGSIERGNFYDVVAILKSPDTYLYDVKVYVKVKPWEYESTTPTVW